MNANKDIKQNSFRVPEDYFGSFPDKLMDRIREEEAAPRAKVRRLQTFRHIRWAAGFIGLALLSAGLLNTLVFNQASVSYEEYAILEETSVYDTDYYLYQQAQETEELNDEEAFAVQAEEYLASGSFEYDYIFE